MSIYFVAFILAVLAVAVVLGYAYVLWKKDYIVEADDLSMADFFRNYKTLSVEKQDLIKDIAEDDSPPV